MPYQRQGTLRLALRLILAGSWLIAALAGAAEVAVTTYHYNNLRTGWNEHETKLSASKFPSKFGVLATVPLDDQVDAQPLLVPGLEINGATHDVVYVVTESNTVYAIDADSGAVLLSRNLGAPVPVPLGCGNNGPNVGITGTPTINRAANALYLIAYVNGSSPSYQLHALALTTLADKVPPTTVAASTMLTDGTTFSFNATYQRQRPALLEQNGTLYAGFGSFCDFDANHSRGWVIGFHASTLAPLAQATVNDTQATSPTDFFLSSVWMSGFGIAGSGSNIFFSTGNSDCNFYTNPESCPSQSTYNGVTNVQESVLSVNSSLTTRNGVFTPSNVFYLDQADLDLGAAGVMLLPTLSGQNLATIVSKDGRLWLLDSDSLGTYLDVEQLNNGCWCGPSFYTGSDGVNRVVSSAGNLVQTWQVALSPTPRLVAEASGTVQSSVQDPGFFTVVSSKGTAAGTAIIWAVARPSDTTGLTLYAFSGTPQNGSLPLLYSSPAGQWPNLGGNANLTPVVANGKVYVASYQALMIFGANGTQVAPGLVAATEPAQLPAGATRRVSGRLTATDGPRVTLRTRTGAYVHVDTASAEEAERVPKMLVGTAYTVLASTDPGSEDLQAIAITRAKPREGAWPPDR
jgi:hypothetical protein